MRQSGREGFRAERCRRLSRRDNSVDYSQVVAAADQWRIWISESNRMPRSLATGKPRLKPELIAEICYFFRQNHDFAINVIVH